MTFYDDQICRWKLSQCHVMRDVDKYSTKLFRLVERDSGYCRAEHHALNCSFRWIPPVQGKASYATSDWSESALDYRRPANECLQRCVPIATGLPCCSLSRREEFRHCLFACIPIAGRNIETRSLSRRREHGFVLHLEREPCMEETGSGASMIHLSSRRVHTGSIRGMETRPLWILVWNAVDELHPQLESCRVNLFRLRFRKRTNPTVHSDALTGTQGYDLCGEVVIAKHTVPWKAEGCWDLLYVEWCSSFGESHLTARSTNTHLHWKSLKKVCCLKESLV